MKKRDPNLTFPPHPFFDQLQQLKRAGERQEGWLQAVLAIRSWLSIPAVLRSPPVTLGKSLTSVVICFPCCKTRPIIQASLTVGLCGEDAELWSTWTGFAWRPHVDEWYLVPYLKRDSQMSTKYLRILGWLFFLQTTISYIIFFLSMKILLSNNNCQTNDTLKLQTTRHSKRINSVRKQILPEFLGQN